MSAGPDTPARVLLRDRGVVTVAPDATLGEAAREMQRRAVGSALVMHDEQGFVGIVTERDLLRAVAASRHPDQASVEEWMTADAITIGPDTTAPNTASTLVQRLVAAGLLEREPDAADRRAMRLRLTPAAHARIDAWRQRRQEVLDHALAGLRPADREGLRAGLPALRALLAELEAGAGRSS